MLDYKLQGGRNVCPFLASINSSQEHGVGMEDF